MLEIDGDRLIRSLRELQAFGQVGPTGVHRTALTPTDIEARHWLEGQMEAAGLEVTIDRYGTVYGRTPGVEKAVLIGSHTDTVPNGGWLDGALGVMYGLEIARTLRALDLPVGVDVISFQDEEGTFVPCLGSKAFCGLLKEGDVEAAIAADGRKLTEELARAELPDCDARFDPARHVAYIEAHIEQGPRLEAGDIKVGVVQAIVGIRRYRIVISGQSDHAGTTPMAMRKDAGAAAIRLSAALLAGFQEWAAEETVWNIGKFVFEPGAPNVVPARAEFVLEFRDRSPERIAFLQGKVKETVESISANEVTSIAMDLIGQVEPIDMTAELQKFLVEAAEWRGDKPLSMPSGAGHDAMIMAQRLPSAMLFVPSIGGRSHDISEDTKIEDIVFGCQVMADSIAKLCGGQANAGRS